jgi:ADP-ribose pyrophosphatase YjhB (NUDIX family)
MEKPLKIRVSVRSICIHGGRMLFQADGQSCLNNKFPIFGTVGGELEPGDKMEERLRLEYKEEAGIDIKIIKYLFVIENFFVDNGQRLHSLEHYFLVKTSRDGFASRESHLSFHWLPVNEIEKYDVRPQVLKEVIMKGDLENVKHLCNGE